jgi:hypothetical protein
VRAGSAEAGFAARFAASLSGWRLHQVNAAVNMLMGVPPGVAHFA